MLGLCHLRSCTHWLTIYVDFIPFQPVNVLRSKVIALQTKYSRSLFFYKFIPSICLLIGVFNAFTFKVVINKRHLLCHFYHLLGSGFLLICLLSCSVGVWVFLAGVPPGPAQPSCHARDQTAVPCSCQSFPSRCFRLLSYCADSSWGFCRTRFESSFSLCIDIFFVAIMGVTLYILKL